MKLAEVLWTLESDAGPALVPGQVVTLSFSCTNAGSATARDVRIALPLPQELVALPSEEPFGCSGELVTELAPRETRTVSRAVSVAACRDGSALEVQARAAIGEGEPAGSNILRFTVCARPSLRFEPPVVVACEGNENGARVGLTVLNDGAGPAHEIRLTLPSLPASTGEDRTWTRERLEPGERWSVTHDVAFDPERWTGMVHLAGVSTGASDVETTQLSPVVVAVDDAPRLRAASCRLVARDGPAADAGSHVRFEVVLSNEGYGDAREVTVALEARGFASLTSEGAPAAVRRLTVSAGTVPAGSVKRIPVAALVPTHLRDGSPLEIGAILRSTTGTFALDPLIYRGRSVPALHCAGWFVAEGSAAQPGAPLHVRLRVGNRGSDDASAVQLRLRLPDGVAAAQTNAAGTGELSVAFGSVAAGSHSERAVVLTLASERAYPPHLVFSGTLEARGLVPLVLPATVLNVASCEAVDPPVMEHDRPDGARPGDTIAYTLHVGNAGTAPAGALNVALTAQGAARYIPGTSRLNGVPLVDDVGSEGLFAAGGLSVHGLAPAASLELGWNLYVERPSAEHAVVGVCGALTTSTGRRCTFAGTPVAIATNATLGVRHPLLGLMLDANVRDPRPLPASDKSAALAELGTAAPPAAQVGSTPAARLEIAVDVEAPAWLRFLAHTRESTLVSHVVALRLFVPDRVALDAQKVDGDALLEPLRSIADRLSIKRRIPQYELVERDIEDASARRALLALARLAREHGVDEAPGGDLGDSALGSVAALRMRAALKPVVHGANERLSAALDAYRRELLAELHALPGDDSFVVHAERAETRALESTRAALVAALEDLASITPRRSPKRVDAA